MSHFSFATPALLFMLLVLVAVALWRLLRSPSHPTLAVADARLWASAAAVGRSWRVRLLGLPVTLRVLAAVLIVFALARPQQGMALVMVPEEGIDIVVALDVSSSMGNLTMGSDATRLESARLVIEDFVGTLKGDRVGLVMFQSRALVLSPLTHDLAATVRRVRAAGPGLLGDGTAIGLGLAESVDLLRESPARSRVVVLLTDGQNNSGEVTPIIAAQVAAALNVHVYTIGFLSVDGTSVVDEATLRRIADLTGASYYDARTQEELAAAYGAIGQLERSRVGEHRFSSFREFAPWLVGMAAGLLTVEVLLSSSWLRRQP